MAIIYSYPIVTPTSDDLILGTDVNADGKPTKNFTVQSIVDIVSGGAAGLGAVIKINSSAKDPASNTNQSATDFLNVQGTGTSTFNVFTDGSMTITGGVGTGFSSITSTDFAGNLTGIVKAGSSIQGSVTGVTQPVGTNNTTLATTAFVMSKVDPSVLTFVGTSGGNQTVNLASQTFSILGTANQIESVGTAQKITFRFPTTGVTLPNGSVATTQAITDNSTKVATTAFVHSHSAAQDLDFSGDNGGTGSVLLDSQVFAINGTANQITTTQSGQSLTIAMPTNITVSGIVNATTFAGDLLGTINTVTTGVTQSAGNNSTKIATTAYVDNAAGSKTLEYAGDATGPFSLNLTNDDLEFNGDSNITITAAAVTGNKGIVTVDLNNNVTITGTSKAGTFTTTAGAATWTTTVLAGFTSITSTAFIGALTGNASTATALAAAGTISVAGDVTTVPNAPTYTSGGNKIINTTIADTVVTAKVLTNLPTPTSATIAASDTILAAMAKLQGQITGIPQGLVYKGTWNATTNTPTLASGTGTTGEFYIVSVAGTTSLDGITDWQVGDWAIFVEVGATDTWQKIDNTSAILGSGTANKIAKWTGSNTLATGLIADNGSTVTVGNSGNLVVEGNTTLGDAVTDTTTVKGPGVFEEALRINKGISLGANTYGSAGQVLTSGGGAGSVNTWTTPTTGTVTSVAAGTGITIGGTAADPTVAIDYLGTDNAILSAPQENGIATTDTVWFSDATDNNIKKTTVANLIALDGARSLAATLAVGNTSGANDILMADSQAVKFGAGNDLTIKHNGTDSQITNLTGNLQFTQLQDDGDITFASDNGSGGDTVYLTIDGGDERIYVSKLMRLNDNVQLRLGDNNDMRLYHNGTTGNNNLENHTNDLYVTQFTDDGDIIFRNDDGSGGVTEYFRIDGSTEQNVVSKNMRFEDNIQAQFGAGSDLRIYHDGSNSRIDETGTGSLIVKTGAFLLRNPSDVSMLDAQSAGAISLYYNGSKKVETTSSGIGMRGPRITFDPTPNSGSNSEYGTIIADSTYGLRLRGSVSGTNSEYGGIYVQQSVVKFPGEVIGVSSPNPQITMMQVNRTILGSGGNVLTIGDATSFGLGYKANSVFQGDVDIKGDLTVDGHIIHGGGGGGTGKGGQFTKLFTSVSGGSIAFTIVRATTGSMIFDVMFTSDTSTSCAIAKKYTVVKSYGASPLYNKILDTGPDFNGSDFTVVFAQHTTDTSIKCTITPQTTATQKIGITLDLGFGQNDATVVMN